MAKHFQIEMNQRYIIPPSMVEKYKDDLCFMVETDNTCMEVVEPRVKFIEPIGYEMSAELIKGYAQIILKLEKYIDCPRWGTCEEKMREVHSEIHSNEHKKKVENVIDSILKESGITQEEFKEIKGIALEMKESGQSRVIVAKPIAIVEPSEGVAISKPSMWAPYATVVQVKPVTI